MRRGQSTLEYILLVGIAAVGLIVMLVYVSRGHQGSLRSQADQLGAGQYAPANTKINNRDAKSLTRNEQSSSATVTKHSDHPVGELDKELAGDPDDTENMENQQGLLSRIGKLDAYIYGLYVEWEETVVPEAVGEDGLGGEAAKVRGGMWGWVQPTADGSITYIETTYIPNGETSLAKLVGEVTDHFDTSKPGHWPERKPDKTTSGSSSAERGTTNTYKQTNETLGSYGGDYF